MTAGEMIRAARKERGLTQRDLADAIRKDFTYVSKIETGKTDVPASEHTYRAIAAVLNLDANKLMAASDRWVKIRASDLDELLTIVVTLLDGKTGDHSNADRVTVLRVDADALSSWWLRWEEQRD